MERCRLNPNAAAQGVKHISVQSSVSLQHLPYDKDLEHELPAEIVDRLAFAKQKLGEIVAAAKSAPGVKPVALTSALPSVGALLPYCHAVPMLLRMASRPTVAHPLLHDATYGGTQCEFAGAVKGQYYSLDHNSSQATRRMRWPRRFLTARRCSPSAAARRSRPWTSPPPPSAPSRRRQARMRPVNVCCTSTRQHAVVCIKGSMALQVLNANELANTRLQ